MTSSKSASRLEDHAGYWLRFVSNHVSQAFARKVEARGVTVAEWVLLREMLDAGATNPSRLAEALGMTRGTVSKLIERLIHKDLVARTVSDQDRRFQSVTLTPTGTESSRCWPGSPTKTTANSSAISTATKPPGSSACSKTSSAGRGGKTSPSPDRNLNSTGARCDGRSRNRHNSGMRGERCRETWRFRTSSAA